MNLDDPYCNTNRDFTVTIWILHVVAVISVPVNLFCAYVILTKSSITIGRFKWYLLLYHSATTLFDFSISIGTVPLTFLPFPMGYPAGVLRFLGVSTFTQIEIVIFFAVVTIVSCCLLFLYRMNLILPANHFMHLSYRGFYMLSTMFMSFFLTVYVTVFATVDVRLDLAIVRIEREYPCLADIVNLPGFMFLDFENPSMMRCVAVVVILAIAIILIILFCIAISMAQLYSKSQRISTRTRQMQKKLVFALMFQTFLPFASVLFPFITAFCVAFEKIPGTQNIGNFLFISISSHGTLSSLSILFFNSSYFRFIKGLVLRNKSSVSHTTQMQTHMFSVSRT